MSKLLSKFSNFLNSPSQNTAEGENLQELIDRSFPSTNSQLVAYNSNGTVNQVTVFKNANQTTANRRQLHAFGYDSNLNVITETISIFNFNDGTVLNKKTTLTYNYNIDGDFTSATQVTV